MIKARFSVICPYCSKENKIELDTSLFSDDTVITCDMDEGGCDKKFVVNFYLSPISKCFKIEGV